MSRAWLIGLLVSLPACLAWQPWWKPTESPWKVAGGPQACRKMCEGWGLEFAGMVGVGDQDPYLYRGATACVCQVAGGPRVTAQAAATAAAMAAPVAVRQEEQEEERRRRKEEREEEEERRKKQEQRDRQKHDQQERERRQHQRG